MAAAQAERVKRTAAADSRQAAYQLRQEAAGFHIAASDGRHVGGAALGMRQAAGGVDAKHLIHAGREIPRIDRPVDQVFTAAIGRTEHHAVLEAAARHHRREAVAVMVPSAEPRRLHGDFGRAAELAIPGNDGARKQSPIRQIREQRRVGRIQDGQLLVHGFEVVDVRIPAAVVDGDEGNAGFHQAPGEQAGLAEHVAAVPGAHRVLLFAEIEGLARVAQDQAVGLFLVLVHSLEFGLAFGFFGERIHRFEQAAAFFHASCGHAFRRDNALYRGNLAIIGIAARCEGLVVVAEESGFRETAQGIGECDVGRQGSRIALLAFLQRDQRTHRRIDQLRRSAWCRFA